MKNLLTIATIAVMGIVAFSHNAHAGDKLLGAMTLRQQQSSANFYSIYVPDNDFPDGFHIMADRPQLLLKQGKTIRLCRASTVTSPDNGDCRYLVPVALKAKMVAFYGWNPYEPGNPFAIFNVGVGPAQIRQYHKDGVTVLVCQMKWQKSPTAQMPCAYLKP